MQAVIEAANSQPIIVPVQLDLESAYDFDSDEEIEDYLKNYTNIDRSTLDTATDIRVEEYAPEGNRFNQR